VRKGLVVEQAEECRKVGGRGGFGVALLESGLDALENTGGLQCGQLVSLWASMWESIVQLETEKERKKKKENEACSPASGFADSATGSCPASLLVKEKPSWRSMS
jgi:hypothetical protein